jgi:hypothetical protein
LSKVVEDLLQGGLVDAVLTYLILALDILHHAEYESYRILVSADLELPGGPIVFDDLEILELALEEV